MSFPAQVTPVIGDGKDSRWIDMLANEALATEWSDPETSNNALCSLLDLPSPLLHRVLSACIKTQSLTRVLTAFPPPLHLSTLISSADNGHVDIHHHPSHLLLMLLSSDLFPPPGLRSLRIGEPRHRAVIPTSSAVLIARAVAAHPSLTSLSIRGTLTAAALRKFHACLVPAAPTNLTSISLRDITINGGPPAAAHTLAAFTSLTHVEIYFNSDTSLSPSLRPYARRVFSPTLLPCLHTLKLIEPGLPGSALCQTSEEGSCIPLFLPLIRAPSITCMTVNRLLTSLSIPALQSALSHYTSLQQLNIVADFADPTVQPAQHSTQHEPKCLPRAHHGPHAPHAANAQHAQHAQHDRQSTATLPSLQRLCVKSACPRCYWTTAAAAASLATGSLTRLTAGVITARSGGSSGSGVQRCVRADAHGRDAWRDALRAIGACTKLEHLELTNLGTADSAGSVHEYTGMLAAVLAPLSRLTEISLVAMSRAGATEPCCELRAGPLMASLQQLPHLKALRLGGGGGQMEFDDAAAVVAGCAALTQLTTVSVCCAVVWTHQRWRVCCRRSGVWPR